MPWRTTHLRRYPIKFAKAKRNRSVQDLNEAATIAQNLDMSIALRCYVGNCTHHLSISSVNKVCIDCQATQFARD